MLVSREQQSDPITRVYVCMCIRVYVYACVCVYVCMCIRVYVYACVCVCVCMCMRVYVYTCACVYVCMCMRVYALFQLLSYSRLSPETEASSLCCAHCRALYSPVLIVYLSCRAEPHVLIPSGWFILPSSYPLW